MAPTPIIPGTLAFLGPAHSPGLAEFRYVRVTTMQGDKVNVAVVSVNEEEEAIAEEVDVSIIKRRRVNDEEGELWPGLATKVKLDQPPNVIKVDWVNYVLQTGTGTNAAAMNANELVMLMDEVSVQCGKSRTALPSKVTKLLPQFQLFVQTLLVISVPRQHVLDCSLNKKGRKKNMFGPPASTPKPVPEKRKNTTPGDGRPATRRKTLEAKDNSAPEAISAVELSPDVEEDDEEADVRAVRRQNRAFEDGLRVGGRGGVGANAPIGGTVACMAPFHAGDEGRGRASTAFRPTAIEQGIHNAIGHPDHQGKDGQCILECAQQARGTHFQATPPVLRGAFDFGFYIRGLSVMHFTSIPRRSTLSIAANMANMTDFSRKNTLLPVTTEPVYTGLTDILSNLCQFGRHFYNDETVSVLRAAATFVEDFADGSEPDQDTTIRLMQWIDRKLGKFRGLVVSDGHDAAVHVKREYCIQDSLLSDQNWRAHSNARRSPGSQSSSREKHGSTGETRQTKNAGGIPASVQRTLPKQGSQELCLKFLSKVGCRGKDGLGKCFSKLRAHFRPSSLSQEAKELVVQRWGGLAAEFTDL
ncbi:hypothetical protein F441_17929 [Phytophthora nicotianae CJ01A1]|uniref:Uncharacterized protein n=1 Tax=Phytophthora nicotianae CJ01A1 TaxID=1317063 RepID=W2W4G7_PHYNI|nr:hypothetical protein F441_17929 [Phytophthora nicotianae CJ01A1]